MLLKILEAILVLAVDIFKEAASKKVDPLTLAEIEAEIKLKLKDEDELVRNYERVLREGK